MGKKRIISIYWEKSYSSSKLEKSRILSINWEKVVFPLYNGKMSVLKMGKSRIISIYWEKVVF